jgi:hypothetical protein
VNARTDTPLWQRSLSAVYCFYDAFYYPVGAAIPPDPTPPITSPLTVSIPVLSWQAFAADDFTYRFSALTLTLPAPTGTNLGVEVTALDGDYVSFNPIQVTLPLPLSSPPTRADFLLPTPLWPTVAVRPPAGETAVRGFITSPTSQSVANLKVEMWLGGGPAPGSPFTFSNANGDFLFRFPLTKGTPGQTVSANIQLAGGAIPVTPAALSMTLGVTQILPFQRT